MEQTSLFSQDQAGSQPKKASVTWRLFVDGASRGNPGRAGAGICLIKDDAELLCEGYFLGTMTNNEAEYWALLLGIAHIHTLVELGARIEICSDSQLLVRQLSGEYKVKKPELQQLYHKALKGLAPYVYSLRHVPREENKRADFLANKGIDLKKIVPEHLRELVR